MSKEQRDKIYENCESYIIEQANGNLASSMIYDMADEMRVPYQDNLDFNIQQPIKLHHLMYTYTKCGEEHGEKLLNIIFYNRTYREDLFKVDKAVISNKEEFGNLQKFMYQNGTFFDEDGIIFKELMPVFFEVYGRNLNMFKEYLELNYLPVFKNILLCSAYSHDLYEIAKENIDVLEKLSILEVIDLNNDLNLGKIEKIFVAYLLDIINSKDEGYINIDYMLQLKEYLAQTIQCPEKADVLFTAYLEANQNLATVEGMLLNHLYNYTPTPYLEVQLRKNQYFKISPEEEALLRFYQDNPQFKIIGNILKYCVENELELVKELFNNQEDKYDSSIYSYTDSILKTYTEQCDVADNLCLLLGKEATYYGQSTTDPDNVTCIIL